MKRNQIRGILILFAIIILVQTVTIIMLVTKQPQVYESREKQETSIIETTLTKTTTVTIIETTTKTITETIQSPTHYLQIIDLAITRTLKPYQVNETYTTTLVSVEVIITVKNTGDRVVTLNSIIVDGKYDVAGFTKVNISPNQTFTGFYSIIVDPCTGETEALYEKVGTYWELGTEHIVTIYYQVIGTSDIQTISQKALVE